MGKFIRLKKGFDINLAGKAALKWTTESLKLLFRPSDFHGIYMPKMVVNEGDTVKAGHLCSMIKKEQIMFTSPVSGEVVEVKRGEKRKLLEVKILADKTIEYVPFTKYTVSEIASLTREKAQEQILKSGVWPNIIQRPGIVADPAETP
jgi:Na+-transporting NADH:ubiquinone oxidoreductase subunit A